jgi:hypothetical protein
MLLKSHYQRASVKASLICATFGLLTAGFINAIFWGILGGGIHEFFVVPGWRNPIIVAIIVLFVASIAFGYVAGSFVYRFGLQTNVTSIIGIALAWCCLFLSAVGGPSVNYFANTREMDAFHDYIVKPAAWVIVVGLLPALLLGLLYSYLVRSNLRNT